jgi:hypothetical protein
MKLNDAGCPGFHGSLVPNNPVFDLRKPLKTAHFPNFRQAEMSYIIQERIEI